jgi:hypothetical protein
MLPRQRSSSDVTGLAYWDVTQAIWVQLFGRWVIMAVGEKLFHCCVGSVELVCSAGPALPAHCKSRRIGVTLLNFLAAKCSCCCDPKT